MYKKILVTLDGSKLSECVLPHLEAFKNGFPECEIILLRVVESIDSTVAAHADVISPDQWKARENAMVVAAGDYLREVTGRLGQLGASISAKVITGRVEDRIIDYAKAPVSDL